MARDTLFSLLPAKLAEGLIAQASTVALAPDQVLFRAGDPCDGCYHVIEGLLKVTVVLPSRRERILAILGPGGFIGELSLMDGAPRSASVIAIKPASSTSSTARRSRRSAPPTPRSTATSPISWRAACATTAPRWR